MKRKCVLAISLCLSISLSLFIFLTPVFSEKEVASQKESPSSEIPQRIIGKDGVPMVLIPAGEFQMGSNEGKDNEKPIHTVDVDAFYMDVYEVTNAQYQKFVEATEYHAPSYWDKPNLNGPNQPVVGVSWHDAMAYCRWAGKRLPTEAEWEKAARGGLKGGTYPWGNARPDETKLNYGGIHAQKPTDVGSYPPTDYGLYDMAGNVWEWCLDEYQSDVYQRGPYRKNPLAGGHIKSIITNFIHIETYRSLRSGSWSNEDKYLRTSGRSGAEPESRTFAIGFRCAKSAAL